MTSYSNEGSALDITAPGGDFVDQSGDGQIDGVLQEGFCYDGTVMLWLNLYGSFCDVYNMGTSMATPHVSGVAALVWSCFPGATNQAIRNALTSTAKDVGGAGRAVASGFGIVQAKAAVDSLGGGLCTTSTTTKYP